MKPSTGRRRLTMSIWMASWRVLNTLTETLRYLLARAFLVFNVRRYGPNC